MKHLLAAAVLLVALSGAAWGASAPAQSPFVGSWTMVSEGRTPDDRRTLTLTVSESGGTYTVACTPPPGADPALAGTAAWITFTVSNVAVKGNALTFRADAIQDGRVVSVVDYALTHSGGKLTGTVRAVLPPPPPSPERRLTATRQ